MSRKQGAVKKKLAVGWGTAVHKLLPGDEIHYVAPISKLSTPTALRLEAIDSATAKRNRKNAKRKGEKKGT